MNNKIKLFAALSTSLSIFWFSTLHAAAPPKSVTLAETANVEIVNSPTVTVENPTDQMVCLAYSDWLLDGTAFPCVKASAPGQQESYSLTELFGDGWVLHSIGPANTNRVTVILRK